MTGERWKRSERAVAAILGGERVPVSGRGRGDQPDVRHPRLSVEVKTREHLPGWLHDAMAQAQAAARDDQIPVAVIHGVGGRHANDICLIHLGDLAALIVEAGERT